MLRLFIIIVVVSILAGGSVGAEVPCREVLVRLEPGVDVGVLDAALGRLDLKVVRDLAPAAKAPRGRILTLELPAGADPVAAAAELATLPGVVGAATNERLHLMVMPNDPMASTQWHIHDPADNDVRLTDAWDVATGDPGTIIAILDTGVDTGHPDLQSIMWTNPGEIPGNGVDDDLNGWIDDVHGWDVGNDDADPRPEVYLELGIDVGFHGTHCAGIAAAATDNGVGIAGAGWGCSLMALKMNSSAGEITVEGLTDAVLYATANGASVLSMSFGGGFADFSFMESLLADAAAAGVICVAAAGNNDTAEMLYPAAFEGVIAVGATDSGGNRASFSTYGAWVDVAAPGQQIWSTVQSNYQWDFLTQLLFMLNYGWDGVNPYMYCDGTSMACPLVAGVCGLIKSVRPDYDQQQVHDRLVTTGRIMPFDQPIGPLVDAHAALLGLETTAVPHGGAFAVAPTAAPNPFNPATTISFALAEARPVRVTVHDLRGRLVRTLADAVMAAGDHALTWRGRDDRGRPAAAAAYLVRIDAGDAVSTRMVALVE